MLYYCVHLVYVDVFDCTRSRVCYKIKHPESNEVCAELFELERVGQIKFKCRFYCGENIS